MGDKVFRDPLYDYISIDRDKDEWLLDLLDSSEVQRLRRIHQLGVSHFTYPGAEHTRFSHTLGVLHLMQGALQHLESIMEDVQVRRARDRLLACAVLHDVGHGPFSHLFEPCLGIHHEYWSRRIVTDPETGVYQVLRGIDPTLPKAVEALIDGDNHEFPCWEKNLLSSQLDVDRLDYLRRDSLFTGAGYGHFNWHRILHTFQLWGDRDMDRDSVWPEKAELAIEEYVFARYYMYWNVYLHKTTRGFEKILNALWNRARKMHSDGTDVSLVKPLAEFWAAKEPSVQQFLALEEAVVLWQIQTWRGHRDKALSDLAGRFLDRHGFAMVEAPVMRQPLAEGLKEWEEALRSLVGKKTEYAPVEAYCLRDDLDPKYSQPYVREKEGEEQAVSNAIRILIAGSAQPIEISERLPRLQPLVDKLPPRVRFYVPKDLRDQAQKLQRDWK
jgi:HD superfamily phosphohydrolase